MKRSVFNVRFSIEERRRLLAIAEARGLSESDVIRDLVAREADTLAQPAARERDPPATTTAEDLPEAMTS